MYLGLFHSVKFFLGKNSVVSLVPTGVTTYSLKSIQLENFKLLTKNYVELCRSVPGG